MPDARVGRLFRLVWGDDVEPALRPVLAVGFAGRSRSRAAWTFIGIWAVDELGASSPPARVRVLAGAVAARSPATSAGTSPTTSAAGR